MQIAPISSVYRLPDVYTLCDQRPDPEGEGHCGSGESLRPFPCPAPEGHLWPHSMGDSWPILGLCRIVQNVLFCVWLLPVISACESHPRCSTLFYVVTGVFVLTAVKQWFSPGSGPRGVLTSFNQIAGSHLQSVCGRRSGAAQEFVFLAGSQLLLLLLVV